MNNLLIQYRRHCKNKKKPHSSWKQNAKIFNLRFLIPSISCTELNSQSIDSNVTTAKNLQIYSERWRDCKLSFFKNQQVMSCTILPKDLLTKTSLKNIWTKWCINKGLNKLFRTISCILKREWRMQPSCIRSPSANSKKRLIKSIHNCFCLLKKIDRRFYSDYQIFKNLYILEFR